MEEFNATRIQNLWIYYKRRNFTPSWPKRRYGNFLSTIARLLPPEITPNIKANGQEALFWTKMLVDEYEAMARWRHFVATSKSTPLSAHGKRTKKCDVAKFALIKTRRNWWIDIRIEKCKTSDHPIHDLLYRRRRCRLAHRHDNTSTGIESQRSSQIRNNQNVHPRRKTNPHRDRNQSAVSRVNHRGCTAKLSRAECQILFLLVFFSFGKFLLSSAG